MRHVVMFSGGVSSWAAAKRVAARHGTERLTLLFADTLIEDPDLYRFVEAAAANVGGTLVRIADGRTPWQVFKDERMLGGGKMHADPCSKILKRNLLDRWLSANCDPADTTVYTGIDWTEEHRHARLRDRRAAQGWRYEAPLCEAPYVTKDQLLSEAWAAGLNPGRLYAFGFSHSNCGGGCVKAGQGHFAHLLRALPDVFAQWERNEQELRDFLGKDVSILRDRRGGQDRPLTLTQLRRRMQGQERGEVDLFEFGGCGCAVDDGAGEVVA